jgi:hypothetical protein
VAEVLGLPQGYEDDPILLYKLAGMIGEKSTRTYENLSLEEYTPLISISPKLNRSICLSSAKLYYSPENKSWYNLGKIGISNIGNTDVNVLADGFMEIKKSESGDIINLFFQLSPSVWYYFNFEENKMVTSSSNNDYNGYIKDKTNAAKANFGEYFFVDGNITDVLGYINRFREEYLGITDPYDLEIPVGMDPDKEREEEVNDGFQIPKEVEKKKEEEDDEGF